MVCPSEEWYIFGRFCYYIEVREASTTTFSMPESTRLCSKMNSSLAKFVNQTELDDFHSEILMYNRFNIFEKKLI